MKPHDLLETYFSEVEEAVAELPVYVEKYIEEILASDRANLRIRLRYDSSGCLLAVNEAVVVNHDRLITLGYRYHCQDAANNLVFRYDDTPHFPNLDSFPHHKHLKGDVITHGKPDLVDVFWEAASVCGQAGQS